MVLLYRKIDKIDDFFIKIQKKFKKFNNKNQKNYKKYRKKFKKNSIFLQNLLKKGEKFAIFREFSWKLCTKVPLYFCDLGKNADTHPWLYKSTLYTFVFWVPVRPTPPHTHTVLLCSPLPGRVGCYPGGFLSGCFYYYPGGGNNPTRIKTHPKW